MISLLPQISGAALTCAGGSRSRTLVLAVVARTERTVVIGKVLVITPKLMQSVIRVPYGRDATVRAIAAASCANREQDTAKCMLTEQYWG